MVQCARLASLGGRAPHAAQPREKAWRLPANATQGDLTRLDAPGKASQPLQEHWMNPPPFSSDPDTLLGAGVMPECPP